LSPGTFPGKLFFIPFIGIAAISRQSISRWTKTLAPGLGRRARGEGLVSLLQAPTITKTAIESVAIGSRLAGDNPQPWEYDDSLPEPVQADWSLVTFSMTREDGAEIEVEMIRPTSFWQQQGAGPCAQVFMEFPELEVSTYATVCKVGPHTHQVKAIWR